MIPDTAIVSDQARKIVYTVNADDVIAATAIRSGQSMRGSCFKAGLKPTDRIVIEGVANPAVRPGTKVAPTNGTIKVPKRPPRSSE